MATTKTLLDRVNYPIAFILGIVIFVSRDALLGPSTKFIDNAPGWRSTAWRNFSLSLDPKELRESMSMVVKFSPNQQMHLLMPRTPTAEDLYWGIPVYDRQWLKMRGVCAAAAMALALVWYASLEFILPRLNKPLSAAEKTKIDEKKSAEKTARDVEDKEPEREPVEEDNVSTWRAIVKTLLDVTVWRYAYEALCIWIGDRMIEHAKISVFGLGKGGGLEQTEMRSGQLNTELGAMFATAEAFASVATIVSYVAFKRLPPAPRAVAFAATPLVQLAVKTFLWAVLAPTILTLSPVQTFLKAQTEKMWVSEQARMAWEGEDEGFPHYRGRSEL